MIIKDDEAAKRLSSPMNLINRLRRESGNGKNNAMQLFGISRKEVMSFEPASKQSGVTAIAGVQHPAENTESFNPFQTPSSAKAELPQQVPSSQPVVLDNIIDNNESKIKLGLAHDKALELLHNSINMLATKLDDVKADKLPAVISAASKTVESIRKERMEAHKNEKDQEVHFHFYTPTQKSISEFEVIDVS